MSKYIHGLHAGSHNAGWDTTGAMYMQDKPGWIVFTEAIGHDPTDWFGGDFSPWLDAGLGVIVRLNNGYSPDGTLPYEAHYADFAKRVAQYIYSTPHAGEIVWGIGNEMQHPAEWPGGPGGEPITPEQYIACFDACYTEAYALIPWAQICIGAVAPWLPSGGLSWTDYLEAILAGVVMYDGVFLHTYTHGHDPVLIASTAKMDFPFQDLYYEFRAYRDFMSVIPDGVPVYITESNPGAHPDHKYWDDVNNQWYCTALTEIDRWNKFSPLAQIRCLAAYRTMFDSWSMLDKPDVMIDFSMGVDMGYTWKEEPVTNGEWTVLAQTSMNDGFYDYQGIGELTVPKGNGAIGDAFPLYEHDQANSGNQLVRPEYDAREDPHVRTWEFAAGMFSMSATQEGCIVFPVSVAPGTDVRASVWTMAQDAAGAGYGTRLGIATEFPGEGAIEVVPGPEGFTGELESRAQWGEWNEADTDGEWYQLWTPVVQSTGSKVWLLLLLRKRYADPAHSHWDDPVVEVRGGSTPEPPPAGDLGSQLRLIAVQLDVISSNIESIAAQVDLLEAGACDPAAIALVEQAKGDLEQALGLMGSG